MCNWHIDGCYEYDSLIQINILRICMCIYVLGFIGLFLTFILTEYYSIKNCEFITTFYNNNT